MHGVTDCGVCWGVGVIVSGIHFSFGAAHSGMFFYLVQLIAVFFVSILPFFLVQSIAGMAFLSKKVSI